MAQTSWHLFHYVDTMKIKGGARLGSYDFANYLNTAQWIFCLFSAHVTEEMTKGSKYECCEKLCKAWRDFSPNCRRLPCDHVVLW